MEQTYIQAKLGINIASDNVARRLACHFEVFDEMRTFDDPPRKDIADAPCATRARMCESSLSRWPAALTESTEEAKMPCTSTCLGPSLTI